MGTLGFASDGVAGAAGDMIGFFIHGSYIHDALARPYESEQEFSYTGYRAEAGILLPWESPSMRGKMGLFAGETRLLSDFEEETMPGGNGHEHLQTRGFGAIGSIVPGDPNRWLTVHIPIAIGYEDLHIDQSGNSPKEQYYRLGLMVRGGIGIGPGVNRSGPVLKFEGSYTYFVGGKEDAAPDAKLKSLELLQGYTSIGYNLQF